MPCYLRLLLDCRQLIPARLFLVSDRPTPQYARPLVQIRFKQPTGRARPEDNRRPIGAHIIGALAWSGNTTITMGSLTQRSCRSLYVQSALSKCPADNRQFIY